MDIRFLPEKLETGNSRANPELVKTSTPLKDTRYIFLINSMSKIIEKMVNNRFIWYIEKHNLLSPLQHGFRNK